MEEKFKSEYKKAYDGIHASDDLRKRVLDAKPSKHKIHVITPFKATLGTIAAAVMIFAAVRDYNFEKDTSGVISETVVSTSAPLPQAEFGVIENDLPEQSVEQETEGEPDRNASVNPVVTQTPVKKPVATQRPQSTPVTTKKPETRDVKATETVNVQPRATVAPVQTVAPTEEIPVEEPGIATVHEVDEENVPAKVKSGGGQQGLQEEVSVTITEPFDEILSGTITETEFGFTGYKISNDIYYEVKGTDREAVFEKMNTL